MQNRRILALASVLISLVLSAYARAELPASLVEELCSPAFRLAAGSSAEARELALRMLGERAVLLPGQPDVWRAQAERMVEGLTSRQAPGTADEVYLRLVRYRYRFDSEAPQGAIAAGGAPEREITASELLLAQRLAAEELAVREATFLERARGIQADLGGRIEFVQPKAGAFQSAREQFLAGAGAKGANAYARSLQGLKQLAQGSRAAAYLVFETPQGQALARLVYGPTGALPRGTSGSMQELVAKLAAEPAQRDMAIQLAFRLDRAVELYDGLLARQGLFEQSPKALAALNRIAGDVLSLSPLGPQGALRFVGN